MQNLYSRAIFQQLREGTMDLEALVPTFAETLATPTLTDDSIRAYALEVP